MTYEINVAYKGHHLFATHARSITGPSSLVRVAALFERKFPKDEGYSILLTWSVSRGYSADSISEFKKHRSNK